MDLEKDIQNVIAEIMLLRGTPLTELLDEQEPIRNVLDSMGILEVLVALEDLGYVTKYIIVDDIETINDIKTELSNA